MTAEQRKELATIRKAMNDMNIEYVDAHWSRYLELEAIEQREYVAKEKPNFEKFYEEHIEGKSFNEIDPEDWEFYSDWHKDMYGFRPTLAIKDVSI